MSQQNKKYENTDSCRVVDRMEAFHVFLTKWLGVLIQACRTPGLRAYLFLVHS